MIESIRSKMKKGAAFLLTLCLLVGMFQMIMVADNASAGQRLDTYMSKMLGRSIGGAGYTYYKNGRAYASGCHAFVNAIWHNAFGYDTYDSVCYTTSASSNFSNIASYIRNNASVGDILRFESRSGNRTYTHSMVIREITETGIVSYEFGGPRHYFSDGPVRESYSYSYLANHFGVSGCYYFLYKSTASPASGNVHVHEYAAVEQDEHPHQIIMQCACGDWYATEETAFHSDCSVCNPPQAEIARAAVLEEQAALPEVQKVVWSWQESNMSHQEWITSIVAGSSYNEVSSAISSSAIPMIISDHDVADVSVDSKEVKTKKEASAVAEVSAKVLETREVLTTNPANEDLVPQLISFIK